MRVETLIKKLQKLDPKANIQYGSKGGILGTGAIKLLHCQIDEDGVRVTEADKKAYAHVYDEKTKFQKVILLCGDDID